MGHRTSEDDWMSFEKHFEGLAAGMIPGQFVVFGAQHPAMRGARGTYPYLQIMSTDEGWLLEVSSNRFVSENQSLQPNQIKWLTENGWDVGLNYECTSSTPRDAGRRARDAFELALGLPHPSLVTVDKAASTSDDIPVPGVADWDSGADSLGPGLSRDVAKPTSVEDLLAMVSGAIAGMLPQDRDGESKPDRDGTITTRVGDTLLLVEVHPKAPIVLVRGIVAQRLVASPKLLDQVNHLNGKLFAPRTALMDATLIASRQVQGLPFVRAHLLAACNDVAGFCDAMRTHLDTEGFFQDKRAIDDSGLGGYM